MEGVDACTGRTNHRMKDIIPDDARQLPGDDPAEPTSGRSVGRLGIGINVVVQILIVGLLVIVFLRSSTSSIFARHRRHRQGGVRHSVAAIERALRGVCAVI